METMRSCGCGYVSSVNIDGTAEFFVGFVQLLSEMTAATLKRTAFVAYPIHAICLNEYARRRQLLIANGNALEGVLLVRRTQEPLIEQEGAEDDEMLV